MHLSIKNEIKTEFAVKIYKKSHRKQTNEDFDFSLVLLSAVRMYCAFIFFMQFYYIMRIM